MDEITAGQPPPQPLLRPPRIRRDRNHHKSPTCSLTLRSPMRIVRLENSTPIVCAEFSLTVCQREPRAQRVMSRTSSAIPEELRDLCWTQSAQRWSSPADRPSIRGAHHSHVSWIHWYRRQLLPVPASPGVSAVASRIRDVDRARARRQSVPHSLHPNQPAQHDGGRAARTDDDEFEEVVLRLAELHTGLTVRLDELGALVHTVEWGTVRR